jgi:hypothetical protein
MSFISKIKFHLFLPHIHTGLSRGALTCATRNIEESDPVSWEFSAFSENGEDGITDFLLRKIISPNRYFSEIGSGNGLHNNTAYLALALKYSGLMVDGNIAHTKRAQIIFSHTNVAVKCLSVFVNNKADIVYILSYCTFKDPDFFSLDIDGIDYYVMKMLFEEKFFPKIICVEYNSSLGPEKSLTIPYRKNFNRLNAHPSGLYYGISVNGWKNFFSRYNYEFVTVCRNGVNAFFVRKDCFPEPFLQKIKGRGLSFAENYSTRERLKCNWQEQFKMIEKMEWVEV